MNKEEQSRAKQREQAVILLNSKREDSLELLGMSIEAKEIIIQLMINFYNSQQPTPQPDVSEDMKIDDFLKEEMNWTDRDLEYRPVIGYWKVVELLQKWRELTKF